MEQIEEIKPGLKPKRITAKMTKEEGSYLKQNQNIQI